MNKVSYSVNVSRGFAEIGSVVRKSFALYGFFVFAVCCRAVHCGTATSILQCILWLSYPVQMKTLVRSKSAVVLSCFDLVACE